jgi:transcriptional regulator with XRE-family HTH domain
MQSDKIKNKFGNNLRQLRVSKHLTQEGLADKTGLHFTYVGQIERGLRNPSLINLYKFAKALGVDANELLPFFNKEQY